MNTDFASFCAPGREASETLDALAQACVETSLIRAEARLAETAETSGCAEALSSVAAWLNARRLWEALGEPHRATLRMHPAFRYFVHGMHRHDPRAVFAFSRHISSVYWAAGLDARVSWRGSVQLDYRGGLRALGYARCIEFGADRAKATAQLSLADDRATFTFSDGLTVQAAREDVVAWPADKPSIDEHGYSVRTCPRLSRTAIPIDTRDPWLRVRLTGTNERVGGAAFDACDDDRYEDDPPLDHIDQGLRLIDTVWPEELDDISRFVRSIVPFRAPPGVHTAFTASSRQGAIFLGGAPAFATAEAVMHEAAHVKLRQIQLLDPLLSDPLNDSVRVQVPWRTDPRPLPGVFEGVFVFARVCELMRRLAAAGDEAARRRHAQVRRDLEIGARLVRENARLTAAGSQVMAAVLAFADIAA